MTGKWLTAAVLAATIALLSNAAQAADCQFILGFATLKALIDEAEGPDKVGACLENQRFNPENGDALQQTTGGLLVWRKADNWTAFTDGYRTWINGPYGLQTRLNTETFPWEAAPEPTPTPQISPTAVAVPTEAPKPVPNYGEWQFGERTDALTETVRKYMYAVAHTVQGRVEDTPQLRIRCNVGEEDSTELLIWWRTYIGGDIHPVARRLDDEPINEWEWIPSTHQASSFAPWSRDGFHITWRLSGRSISTLQDRPLPNEFAARVTKPDKTHITAVWRVTGSNHAYDRLMQSCNIPGI